MAPRPTDLGDPRNADATPGADRGTTPNDVTSPNLSPAPNQPGNVVDAPPVGTDGPEAPSAPAPPAPDDDALPPPAAGVTRVTATQTGSALTLAPLTVAYGAFELVYVDARTNGSTASLHFEADGQAFAENEIHVIDGLAIGSHVLCAQTCATITVVPPTLAAPTEPVDQVTVTISDWGVDAPYREISHEGPSSAWTSAPANATLRLYVPPNASTSYTVHLAADDVTPAPTPNIIGGWTLTIAPGELVDLNVRALSSVQMKDCWVPGCRLDFFSA